MRRRGAIRHATMRRPGPALTAQHLAEIDLLLRRLNRSLEEMAGAQARRTPAMLSA
jgi:4-hydroxy-tetrahydrodipicolinate synthase